MKNVFILNAASPIAYPGGPEGKANASLVAKAQEVLTKKGYEVRVTVVHDGYDAAKEVEQLMWADTIIINTPCYWFSVPAAFKGYLDSVLSSGLDGRLCNGDGRHRDAKDNGAKYATGGTLKSKYMITSTFNAPEDAFKNEANPIIKGKTVDDVFYGVHMSMQFCGCTPIDSFSAHDVMKNPQLEKDLEGYEEHLNKHFPNVVDPEKSA
jgi:modulator of drug activity B